MNLGSLIQGLSSLKFRDVLGCFAYLRVVSPYVHGNQLRELPKISLLQGRVHEQIPSSL